MPRKRAPCWNEMQIYSCAAAAAAAVTSELFNCHGDAVCFVFLLHFAAQLPLQWQWKSVGKVSSDKSLIVRSSWRIGGVTEALMGFANFMTSPGVDYPLSSWWADDRFRCPVFPDVTIEHMIIGVVEWIRLRSAVHDTFCERRGTMRFHQVEGTNGKA